MKKNCWEAKNCGRQAGGAHEKDLGICPASTERNLDTVHGGKNAGRACWVVAGTLCGGKVQGSFAKKYENCEVCDFYRNVRKEEGANFQITITLIGKLKNGVGTPA